MTLGIIITFIFLYTAVICWLTYGMDKVPVSELIDLKAKTTFSIVIPFRNEEENLPRLLNSLKQLKYPFSHFEIILIDDDSHDKSIKIIENFQDKKDSKHLNIRILKNKRLSNSPKKDAITIAIKHAKYNWIITTDADCKLPNYWLDSFDEFIQTNDAIAICGPVLFKGNTSFFHRFQSLDTLSLQGVTMGSFGIGYPFMCNGANFAYKKSSFKTVNGFDGNDNIASGDDIFLLEKFLKLDKKRVFYLKNTKAIVTTDVAKNLKSYFQQRLRWASKSTRYNSLFAKLLGLLVLVTNITMIALIPLLFFKIVTIKATVLIVILKLSCDYLLLYKTVRFFNEESLLSSFIFGSLIYPFLNIFIIFMMPFKGFRWKGRQFKR